MKMYKKLLLIPLSALVLHSCYIPKPVASYTPENNKTYTVYYLFEHEGCKVYRFEDFNNTVYFTNCRNDITSISSDSTKKRIVNLGTLPIDDH
jgi:hypothetical protein